MSRSRPQENRTPNPATRFYEWAGSDGVITYYDKEAINPKTQKKGCDISIGSTFVFIVLDELATIRGWDEAAHTGIVSNEVHDTNSEPFLVKNFKGRIIANGLYSQIKDTVKAADGYYTQNIYIAYKPKADSPLVIGALQLAGHPLNVWVEFKRANPGAIYSKAIMIKGTTEHQKGKIQWKAPIFHTKDISEETNKQAQALDAELQTYLDGYFKRKKTEAVPTPQQATPSGTGSAPGDNPAENFPPAAAPEDDGPPPPGDDDIPF